MPHFCPDEAAAIVAFLTAGPLLIWRYARHKVGCFCRWCAEKVRRN